MTETCTLIRTTAFYVHFENCKLRATYCNYIINLFSIHRMDGHLWCRFTFIACKRKCCVELSVSFVLRIIVNLDIRERTEAWNAHTFIRDCEEDKISELKVTSWDTVSAVLFPYSTTYCVYTGLHYKDYNTEEAESSTVSADCMHRL